MKQGPLDVGLATLTLSGESECGDLALVAPFMEGILVAAIDGIGHGPEAAAVARIAEDLLKRYAHEPVKSLVNYCHESLRNTRGAVMSLASFNTREGTMTWTGVGNVEGRLFSADAPSKPKVLLSSMGTLGHRTAPINPMVLPVTHGDTLILVTDGVNYDFHGVLDLTQSPQQIADSILALHALHTDDALVVVTRYRGAQS